MGKIISVDEDLSIAFTLFTGPPTSYLTNYKDSPIKNSLISNFVILKEFFFHKFGLYYQIISSENIIDEDQLKFALYHAKSAFSQKSNILKSLDVEFLLYLSQERQIKLALEKIGIKEPNSVNDEMNIVEIIFGNPKKIDEGLMYLEKIHKSGSLSDIKYQDCINWDAFIEFYGITFPQIINSIKADGIKIDSNINTYKMLMEIIQPEILKEHLLNLYNVGLVKLFLQNLKGRSKNLIKN